VRAFFHIVLHFLVPFLWVCFFVPKGKRKKSLVILWATMLVDLDHLWADPVYDPHRCSIGFHALHGPEAIAFYVLALFFSRTRLPAIGLLIHMALDFLDCCLMGRV
jgi:hypothetical protein